MKNTDSTPPSAQHCGPNASANTRRELATLLRAIDRLPRSQARSDAEVIVLDVVRREVTIGRSDLITLLYVLDQIPTCDASFEAEALVLDALIRIRETERTALAPEAAE